MQENNNQNTVNEEVELSEILKIRRDKLTALCEEGKNPFEITKYDVTALSADAIKEYEAREEELNASGEQITVSIGGRMMSRRIMGKASFAHVMDDAGKIQVYVSRNDIGDEDYASFP